MIHLIIETERLLLREYTPDDFDALYEILSDPETMRHYPAPFDEARTRRWIEWNLENYAQYGFGLWAVVLKETGEFIGDCGITIQDIDGEMLPEIGYHIHRKYWRRGFAKEAAREVRDWVFRNTEYDTVYSYMKYSNIGSWSTAVANGMRKVKEYPDPKNTISYAYAISRREWETLKEAEDRMKDNKSSGSDPIGMPASIAAILGRQDGKTDELGKSGARVLLFEDYVLKIRPAGNWDTADVEILRWLAGKAPVPQVAAHEVWNGRDWLLMTRIRGKELCKPDIMNNPVLLLDCMAEALYSLWSIPVADCPFERTVADNLSHAETAIRTGRFDPSDCEPETFGPGGFENPEALLNWLKSHLPEQDRVVTHGDFCLPNLFTDGKKFTGFIDVGNAGAGDRWMDLALGWRSLKHNSDGHYGKIYPDIHPDDLFRAAGVPKDEEKLRYYILLDELN